MNGRLGALVIGLVLAAIATLPLHFTRAAAGAITICGNTDNVAVVNQDVGDYGICINQGP